VTLRHFSLVHLYDGSVVGLMIDKTLNEMEPMATQNINYSHARAQPIIAADLKGVLHTYSSDWTGGQIMVIVYTENLVT
jgi:hypothetical protein